VREEFSLRLIALVATVSGNGIATRAEATEGGEPASPLPKVDAQELEEGSAEVPPATASVWVNSEPDRKWARDTLTVAAGVLTAPSYNGSDSNVLLPGLFVRGRQDGYSFVPNARGGSRTRKSAPSASLTARLKWAALSACPKPGSSPASMTRSARA
jgi:hypothetical protein